MDCFRTRSLNTSCMLFSLIILFSMVSLWKLAEGWSYHHSDHRMTWSKAESWCKQYYTNMVAIQNHDEIEHLNSILPKKHGHYWIGIRKVNGTWVWVGTGKPLTADAENWADEEPNNRGIGQDCVEIYIKRKTDAGKWNDDFCTNQKTALCYTASCTADSCGQHGECVEIIDSHKCECFEGFYGAKCEHVIQCPAKEVSSPLNGIVHCSHSNGRFAYASHCQYSCSEGYQISGSQTTRCEASKTWSNEPPTCEVVQCSKMSPPAQGTMQCEDPLGHFSYRSACGFTCEEGYTLTGSGQLVCGATGHWNDSVPTCEAVRCPSLEEFVHGTVSCSGDSISFGSTCSFKCDDGFRLQGAPEITCTESAQWSQKMPYCEAVMCPHLLEPVNGFISCSSEKATVGTVCSFDCLDGYNLHGSKMVMCNLNGNWSGEEAECQAVHCPPLEEFVHGTVSCSGDSISFGSTCSFSCEDGFRLKGAPEITCTESAQWSQKMPYCEVMCPHLLEPVNGFISCSSEKATVGTVCSFDCLDGYHLHGSKMVMCSLNGNWSGEETECKAVHCPSLEEFEHGTVSCSGDIISFGSTCSFSCNDGFRLQGAPEITCTESAQWSQKMPYCEVIRCRLPGEQIHLSSECSRSSDDLTVNSTCHFSCETGFDLQGAVSTECTETGEWSSALPHCTAVMCPHLQEPVNGFISCSSEKATVGTVCSFDCLDGYHLHGYEMVMCNLNGNWSGEEAECQAPSLSRPLMAGLSLGAGATALSFIGLALWVMKRLRQKAKRFNLSNSDINVPHQTYKSSTDSLI
ncbi:E-selectin-like isoform X2 [Brachyhypopomus gauderio]|uniref:E-selectin-like isoform X2 n=1 Tax=Brachyhypopomus gauderio TaxID=698409 RepID=UPI004042D694